MFDTIEIDSSGRIIARPARIVIGQIRQSKRNNGFCIYFEEQPWTAEQWSALLRGLAVTIEAREKAASPPAQ